MGCGFPQLCGNQLHATFAFCQTEPALHFHTLAFIPVVLSLAAGFILQRYVMDDE